VQTHPICSYPLMYECYALSSLDTNLISILYPLHRTSIEIFHICIYLGELHMFMYNNFMSFI